MGLEKSMIIQKKAKELPLRLILKSVFLTLLTWLLWMYSLYAIYTYAQKIFAIPVLEQFFFPSDCCINVYRLSRFINYDGYMVIYSEIL